MRFKLTNQATRSAQDTMNVYCTGSSFLEL